MLDWQFGIQIEELKSFADVFQQRHKKLVFGAFGLVKERDIAQAMHSKNLLWTKTDGKITCVAITKYLSKGSNITDFTGTSYKLPADSIKVSSFAALTVDSGIKVVNSIKKYHRPIFVEIFEEDPIAKQTVNECALNYMITKIAAGSEIKGIYSNAKFDIAYSKAELTSLAILQRDFLDDVEIGAILTEVKEYNRWAQHYSSYNVRHSWTAFAIKGYNPNDPDFIIKPDEMSKAWQAENAPLLKARCEWTKIASRFPTTMAVVYKAFGDRKLDRVRFMRLTPKGELSRHADITNRQAGVADGRLARIHIPIITSKYVIFHGWDKRGNHIALNFPERSICYLDQRGPHRVENTNPSAERIHLVADVVSDASLRQRISDAIAV